MYASYYNYNQIKLNSAPDAQPLQIERGAEDIFVILTALKY